jgi:hypothetical protein
VRESSIEEFLSIDTASVDNVRSTADSIISSCVKPPRPPLVPRAFETPRGAKGPASFAAPPCTPSGVVINAGTDGNPTEKLLMTAFVSKV